MASGFAARSNLLRAAAIICLALAGTLLCGHGWAAAPAQPATKGPPFETTLEAAKAALLKGELSRALKTFERCEALATRPTERWRSWLGQALTLERQRRNVEALRRYHRFLSVPQASLDARWLQRQREVLAVAQGLEREALKTELAVIRVESRPNGANVELYGADLDASRPRATPATLFVKPGRYRLRVSAPGHGPKSADVQVVVGERRTFVMELAAETPVGPVGSPPMALEQDSNDLLAWDAAMVSTAGVGGILMITGVVFHVLYYQDGLEAQEIDAAGPLSDSSKAAILALTKRGKARQLAAGVFYGVGAASLLTTLILALERPTKDSAAQPSLWLMPSPGGISAELSLTF